MPATLEDTANSTPSQQGLRLSLLMSELDNVSDSARVEISRDGGLWDVSIRPIGGGYPLRAMSHENLSVALEQAINAWEDR